MKKWLDNGFQAGMSYMDNHFDKRISPEYLVPGAKSIITFTYNYHTEQSLLNSSYKISKYAYGRDYHKVIKRNSRVCI
ncbi:MAG: DUF1730 domain-containing protein [Saprospiraceae bacterium]